MSQRLLGLDPEEVGGATAKASFAKALTERCVDGDRIDALVDVILVSQHGVDPRVRDVAGLFGREDLAAAARSARSPSCASSGRASCRTCTSPAAGARSASSRRSSTRPAATGAPCSACSPPTAWSRPSSTRACPGTSTPARPTASTGSATATSTPSRSAPAWRERARRTSTRSSPCCAAILEPLAALHKARIVHGDLKLENVLVGRGAEGGQQVTLIDFGTDRLRQRPTVANGHTGVLAVIGSPKTIAPEQVRGMRADPASDVYSFGAMMYELLSGKPVFDFDFGHRGRVRARHAVARAAERQGSPRLDHARRRPVRPAPAGKGPRAATQGRRGGARPARVPRARLGSPCAPRSRHLRRGPARPRWSTCSIAAPGRRRRRPRSSRQPSSRAPTRPGRRGVRRRGRQRRRGRRGRARGEEVAAATAPPASSTPP